jgi:hypothetical protein
VSGNIEPRSAFLGGAVFPASSRAFKTGVLIMIRITTNVVLWKKSDLLRPENLRISLLVIATIVLAFLVSPILGVVVVGLMLWQSSKAQ